LGARVFLDLSGGISFSSSATCRVGHGMQVRVRKGADYCHIPRQGFIIIIIIFINKKHLKNVGPIRYCEPPHAHSPDVASGTVVRRLRIVVHDNDDDNDNA